MQIIDRYDLPRPTKPAESMIEEPISGYAIVLIRRYFTPMLMISGSFPNCRRKNTGKANRTAPTAPIEAEATMHAPTTTLHRVECARNANTST